MDSLSAMCSPFVAAVADSALENLRRTRFFARTAPAQREMLCRLVESHVSTLVARQLAIARDIDAGVLLVELEEYARAVGVALHMMEIEDADARRALWETHAEQLQRHLPGMGLAQLEAIHAMYG